MQGQTIRKKVIENGRKRNDTKIYPIEWTR